MTDTRFPGSPFPDYGLPILEEAASAPSSAAPATGWDAAFAKVEAKRTPTEEQITTAGEAATGWDRAFQRRREHQED